MIFTLVSAVQEKLNEIVDQIKTRREEEKKQKEREAEEEEKVCKTLFLTKKLLKIFLFFFFCLPFLCMGLMQEQLWARCSSQCSSKLM